MNISKEHWDKLRVAIQNKGIGGLVSESGPEAIQKLAREAKDGPSVDSFDPLMAAYLSIGQNGMRFIGEVGGNPTASMLPDAQPHEKCVICHLNWLADDHERRCEQPNCPKPPGEAAHWEWMIERAASDQVDAWNALKDA
jgi:hypothetical protein